MVRFDYEATYLVARGSSSLILKYWNLVQGYDFILNEDIVKDTRLPARVRSEYLGFCALRNYSDYHLYKYKHLDLNKLPLYVPIQLAEQNPLLKVTQKEIIFIYE